jgi:L-lactate dehydrogenase complex protein LldG
MSARDAILAAVRAARPSAVAAPEVASVVATFPGATDATDLVARFTAASNDAGAQVVMGSRGDLDRVVRAARSESGRLVSAIDVEVGAEPADQPAPLPHAFADTDVYVCEAVFGVAENGAVWLPLSRLRHRSAVFLATHVVVVLERVRLVADLHAAYEVMDLAAEGFGVLVAGPSKTADIEQALVIGAHGAKSLTVLLV